MFNPHKEDSKIFAIFLVVLIDVLGFTILIPVLPYYSQQLGASPFVVGLLVSTYAVCQLIASPLLGKWSDLVGRKPVLILSQIGTFIGFLILAKAHSLTLIFVSRIIDGLTAGNLSIAQAYIVDHTSSGNRAKALGKISIAFGIGYFIGPAITAFLFKYGYEAPIYAAATLSFLSILTSVFLLTNEDPSQNSDPHSGAKFEAKHQYKNLFKDPSLKYLLLTLLLFYFAFSIFVSGLPLFAERRFVYNGTFFTSTEIGYAITYLGFLGIVIQGFLLGKLVNHLGEERLSFYGFIFYFIGFVFLGFTQDFKLIFISGLFISLGAGILRPTLLSILTKRTHQEMRGYIIGFNNSLQSLAQIISPLIGTAIIETRYITSWAFLPAFICSICIFLLIAHKSQFERN